MLFDWSSCIIAIDLRSIIMANMLTELNFKPSSRLKTFWMCLPQKSTAIGSTKVPGLFSDHKSFVIQYLFFIVFIILEIYAILSFSHRGVDINVLLLLAIAEIVIALIPLLFELLSNENCKAWVESQLYVNKIKLKYFNSQLTAQNAALAADIKKWQMKYNRIQLINLFIGFIIILLACSKYYIYYQIYGSELINMQIGRLLIFSIVIGVFTHIWCTKTVILAILLAVRQRSEISQKRAGNASYIYNTDPNMNRFWEFNLDTNLLDQNLQFRFGQTANLILAKKFTNVDGPADGQVLRNYRLDGGQMGSYYANLVPFSDDAILLHNQFIKDEDVVQVVNMLPGQREKELITSFGRENQLN